MSGHSKWHKIKHQKGAADQKKSKVFGQLARDISIAARGEKDPAKNAALRDAVQRAKKANMPQVNIDRLLSVKNTDLQTVIYEVVGPGGCFLIITATTDNTNRTLADLKTILKNHGGSLGKPGSARWKFEGDNPTFPTPLNTDDYTKFESLLQELQSHSDIQKVITDATPA